jgi:hypothetical protein
VPAICGLRGSLALSGGIGQECHNPCCQVRAGAGLAHQRKGAVDPASQFEGHTVPGIASQQDRREAGFRA